MLTFMGFHMPLDGYGYGTLQIARELKRIDPTVSVLDMQTADGFGMAGDREWHIEGQAVALCTPDWLPFIHADRLVAYTMFEASKLPKNWANLINQHAQACLVPSAWCAEMFRVNGVSVPIEVVKWGINPEDYWPVERNNRADTQVRPYTFLWSGTADQRKGWDVAYIAFMQAFGQDPRVQLHLHFRDPLPANPRFADKNVRVTIGRFDRPELRLMLHDADCFVFPSRGEGWGSPPREAAATGLPTLVTNFGGLHEDMPEWAMPIGFTGFSPAEYGWWGTEEIGEWVEPSIDDLVEAMRWCAEHPSEAMAFGRRSAEWLRTNGTWQRTAQGVLNSVREAA